MRKVVISTVIVVAVVMVVGFVPLVEAEYQYTETYYEDEPYEVIETYYVDEPYEVTETYNETVSVEMEILEHRLVQDVILLVQGKVKNTGDQTHASIDVTIWVEYEIEDLPGQIFRQPTGIGLNPPTFEPGAVREFTAPVQDEVTNYEIIPPTTTKTVEAERTVTKYRQIKQERTVTKYRQVEKERLVIQYKKVPIFEYLRS
jgi:hypothetical protein